MEVFSVDTVICPRCRADLDVNAVVCHQCGASTAAPPSADTDPSVGKPDRLLDRPWLITVVLLHVGVLGIPMYWKTKYTREVRVMIVAASIVYTIVALGIIVGVGGWLLMVFLDALR